MPTPFRKGPIRAHFWDYSDPGCYFLTVVTAGRQPILGEIVDGKMIPSAIGQIVEQEFNLSFEIRKELFCDIFQLMPDHFHAIVRLVSPHGQPVAPHGQPVAPHGRAGLQVGVAYRPPKSISSFMAGFKSSATKKINEFRQTPGQPVWQPRFYDRIIRDEDEYERIKIYIEKNPENWKEGERDE